MLKLWLVDKCRAFFKWLFLMILLFIMLSPVVLLELDTWENILLKIYGVETYATVIDKSAHVERINIPRLYASPLSWKEFPFWMVSYSLLDHENETNDTYPNIKTNTADDVDYERRETNRLDDQVLERSIELGSKIKVTYIPGWPGYAEVSDNMHTLSYSIYRILKVFFVSLLGVITVVAVSPPLMSISLKNDDFMKG